MSGTTFDALAIVVSVLDAAGVDLAVATAEDTVLAKLERAAATDSERQVRDVVDQLRTAADPLDDAYLDHWAEELGVDGALRRARGAARRFDPES